MTALCGLLSGLVVAAKDAANAVSFSPTSQNFEGAMPYTESATVLVTAPSTLTGPATVDLLVEASGIPFGTATAALSYITLTPSQLNFTGPGSTVSVTVRFTLPNLSLPPGTLPVNFAYNVTPDLADLPVGTTLSIYSINARATTPPDVPGGLPPTVSISTPSNGQLFNRAVGEPLGPIPLQFTAVATANAPIVSIEATLVQVSTGIGIPLVVIPSGIGTATATGTASMPIAALGDYTVTVRGTNVFGQDIKSHGFTVASGPTVQITSPAANAVFAYDANSPRPAIPFSFKGTSTAGNITGLTASLNGVDFTASLATTGINSSLVATGALANLAAAVVGENTLVVTASTAYGTATATSKFYVNPVTIAISAPTASPDILLPAGATTVNIPFTFRTTASDGFVVSNVSAWLDNSATNVVIGSAGTGGQVATTTGTLLTVGEGTHTLLATGYSSGVGVSTSVTFRVVARRPTPTIVINDPDPGAVIDPLAGELTADVPFSFTTTTSPDFTIDNVYYKIDGGAWTEITSPISAPGLRTPGTTAVTAVGDLQDLAPGSHTFYARGISYGIAVETSVTFTITQPTVVLTPPTVTISSPALASYPLPSSGPLPLTLTFKGSSTMTLGKITQLTATLTAAGGSPIVLTVPAFTPAHDVQVSIPLSLSVATTYTINVTATDAGGTANTSKSFSVTPAAKIALNGLVFLDLNYDGDRDTGEPGLAGITVKLLDGAGATKDTKTTGAGGAYSFSVDAGSGTNKILVSAPIGLSPTSLNYQQTFTIGTVGPITALDAGFSLNWAAIRTLNSTALSQGFWKNNVNKAKTGKETGTQVSLADMLAYTANIKNVVTLAPHNNVTSLVNASTVFSGKNQLALQLLASEYNYLSGAKYPTAYIGGSAPLTYAFLYWAETVMQNTGGIYSSAYQTFAAKWCEAYNTSEGGKVLGPLP